MTPDWNQAVRNVLYGAVHRPAQVLEWVGGLIQGPAEEIGQALVSVARRMDNDAAETLSPYVPPLPVVTIPAPPTRTHQPRTLPQWVKPSGTVYPFLTCPSGYHLVNLAPGLALPYASCLLDGDPPNPPPPPSEAVML